MAKVFVNDTSLQDVADAIREKNGSQDTYTPSQMGEAVRAISGGGGGVPEEALNITGNCRQMFQYGKWDWFIREYGNRITTKDITDCRYMFNYSKAEIPFEINCSGSDVYFSYMFSYYYLKLPKVNGQNITGYNTLSYLFSSCSKEVNLENLNINFNALHSSTASINNMFYISQGLTRIDKELLKNLYTSNSASYNSFYYNAFDGCWRLLKIEGLPVYRIALTSNAFNNTVRECYKLKDLFFDVNENNQPYVVNWSKQTIDFSTDVGYGALLSIGENRVTDDATYQQYKNEEDWWTKKIEYSRYNHDSAVNTINSLPDVTQGSTNVIKFKGASGSLTDGGAINTLTEEEIAVAAAKGWTVTLV